MDYAGICSLITTSAYPIIFYAFKNQRYLMVTYLSMISFFGILCIIVTSIEKFAAIDYRCHRAILFTLFGFINIVPFSHFVSLYGCSAVYHVYGGKYVLLSAAFYLSGVCIYANRIPEKVFPQFFNIWVF
uniref:Adiponectin receptor protein 1 (Trinotate prediction) n=1 Tax=Myxobolus squamalis TaxID=59785 RepID=A0A6B2G3E4_MYXSQ